MVKSDEEIGKIIGELRDWLFEKGVVEEDVYEVLWDVLVDIYMEEEVSECRTWRELVIKVKKIMERELSWRLGVWK